MILKNKYSILFIMLFLIFSCTTSGPGTMSTGGVYDIQYLYDSTNDTVKRGDELTITFKVKENDTSVQLEINDLTIDSANSIAIIDPPPSGDHFVYTDESLVYCQQTVEFNWDVSEDVAEEYRGEYCKWWHPDNTDVSPASGGEVYASQYTYLKLTDGITGVIKVIVPENAKSGYTRLRPYRYPCQSWSEYALIVVDESGDEIW